MAFINKHDTDGTKGSLLKGEFGLDDYVAGGDTGRVYIGDGTVNIPLGKKSEIVAVAESVTEHAGSSIAHSPATQVLNGFMSSADKGKLDGLGANATIPTGAVFSFVSLVVPLGFLECNGDAVSRTTYADLYAIMGTLYGAGDEATTFNLPDLRGEFIRGADNGRGVDTGRSIASTQADDTKPHTHSGPSHTHSTPNHTHSASSNSTGAHSHSTYVGTGVNPGAGNSLGLASWSASGGTSWGSNSTGAHSHSITVNSGGASTTGAAGTGATGSSGTTETRPRNIAMMFCIKT